MAALPVENFAEFQDVINRSEPTIIYFFDENGGPGPELEHLLNGAAGVAAFFADIDQCHIERDARKLPQTVLYKGGEELGDADGGDMDMFFELCERAQSEA
ncbi:hypothetical protein N7533_003501 [Penicillium manginii]|uniref:uncharacterized protein n=1 Tax=Penicillium manginii TaxID=203109 RepID=UPI0025474A54|nr:uncharacterized protein N7533_003501 [Penicillium manginii]KAJ5761462.1 hypothetical protein N7533_003501 [Penicillium manginii]